MWTLPIRRRAFLGLALSGALSQAWRAHPVSSALAGDRPAGVPSALSGPQHGIAMHGLPALPADFAHLPYSNPNAIKGGTLSLGFSGTFDSLNPFNVKAGSAAQGLSTNVFQSLMARNGDEPFSLYAQIASSLEIDAAREHLVFHLNPKARFSDGAALTAEDVLFTFELLKTKGRPQQRSAYSLVKSIVARDAHTITYDLSGANDRELPLILALMPVLPKHRTDVAKFAEASLLPPLGSGPYLVTSVKPGDEIVLTRDQTWWGADLQLTKGLFNFDQIRIQYFRDANTLYEAFKAGLIDYRDETSPTRWLSGYEFPAARNGLIKREKIALGGPKGMQGFVFNTRRPLFDDIKVREALIQLFDFEWINAKFFGGLYHRTKSYFDESPLSSHGRPADQKERALLAPFPGVVREDILEGTWSPPISDGSGRDRTLAHRALGLLQDAGWEIEAGELMHKLTREKLAFEIMVSDRAAERLALIYADTMQRLGILARVRVVDDVQYQRRRQNFDFDMTIGSWIASASPGNEQRNRWASTAADQPSSFNLAGVKSPAVDAMIAQVLSSEQQDDFEAAVRALDRVLLSGFWIVPLYHAPDAWVAYSAKLSHPPRPATYSGAAPFGTTLETLWRTAS